MRILALVTTRAATLLMHFANLPAFLVLWRVRVAATSSRFIDVFAVGVDMAEGATLAKPAFALLMEVT